MSRSPSRDRARARAGRTTAGSSGGGGGGGFDPATLAGLQRWHRAKDLTLGATPTSWTDNSGSARTATLSGAVVRPFTGFPTTATASSTAGGDNPTNAFDPDATTTWSTNATATGWLQGQYPVGFKATQYWIKRRDGFDTRMPKDFTLQGSNNGSSWTTLDTRTNITWPTAGETKTFTFTNTTSYTYYRLDVTANNGDTYLSVGEFGVARSDTGQAVFFGNGTMSLPSDGGAGTEREIWIVLSVKSGYENSRSWGPLGTSGGGPRWPYSDGNIYEDAFITTRPNVGAPVVSVYTPRIYRVAMNSAGTWLLQLDNTLQHTSSKTLGIQTAAAKIANGWDGQIAEVIQRSQVSTAGEITDLITYFNTEHGLTVT